MKLKAIKQKVIDMNCIQKSSSGPRDGHFQGLEQEIVQFFAHEGGKTGVPIA
jgi:hypothetical protein